MHVTSIFGQTEKTLCVSLICRHFTHVIVWRSAMAASITLQQKESIQIIPKLLKEIAVNHPEQFKYTLKVLA